MRVLSKQLVVGGVVACALLSAGSVVAQSSGGSARLEIVNGTLVSESKCVVSGRKASSSMVLKIKEITHSGKSKTYDVAVPAGYDFIHYSCRATKRASDGAAITQSAATKVQELARVPLSSQQLNAGCSSARSDGQCSVNLSVR